MNFTKPFFSYIIKLSMSKRSWVIGVFFALIITILSGSACADKYVKPGGDDADTGTDEARAWLTLTYASTAAAQYETVHVLAGTYSTLESFPISLDSRRMAGYGTGLVTIDASGTSQRTFALGANATLEGIHQIKNSDRYAIEFNGVDSRVLSSTIETTTVDSVRFQSGGDNCSLISCEVSSGAQSTLYFASGAIDALIRDCVLVNTKNDGYVVYPQANSHSFTLDGNTIRSAGSLGYGILFNGNVSGYSILNNTFTCESSSSSVPAMDLRAWGEVGSNEVRGFGTGILINSSASTGDITIEGNTIIKCGTGVQNNGGSITVYLKKNIISAAPGLGFTYINDSRGIYWTAGTMSLESNCVWNNEADYSGVSAGGGDISACPRFVDVNNDDYRLYSDSPCLALPAGRYGSVGVPSAIVEVMTAESNAQLNQAATLAASAIILKTGNYSITAPLELGNGRVIRAFGNGLASFEAGNDAHTLTLGVASTVEGTGVNNNYSGKYGIYAYGSDNLVSGSTVEADSGANGIYLDGSSNLVANSSLEVDSGTGISINGANNIIYGSGISNVSGSNGIYVSSTGHYTTIESCSVSGSNTNSLNFSGNALSPHVLNCSVRNTNNGANAVYLGGSTHNFLVSGSAIRTYGHGIYHTGSAGGVMVYGNLIISEDPSDSEYGLRLPLCCGWVVSNEVRGFGVGVNFDQPLNNPVTLEANTIVKCKKGVRRANVDSETVYVNNCVISSSPEGGAGIPGSIGVEQTNGNISVDYSDVYGNAVDYSGTITLGSGTISAAALFADPANDDYHLTASSEGISPCIDSGDPASPPDPDGTRKDMGAYFYNWIGVPPVVRLTTAEAGVSVEVGTPYNITWTATQPAQIVQQVDIDLSADGGSTFAYSIVSGTDNDGLYEWNVSNDAPRTTEARVRVQAVDSTSAVGTDESNSNFTIFGAGVAGPTLSGITLSDRSSGGQNYTNARVISVEAQNVAGSPAQMIISLNIDFVGVSWEVYQNPATFELSVGDGAKTVYYKLRDTFNNPSETVEASIVLDTLPPLVMVVRPTTHEVLTAGRTATIEYQATDATSGIPASGIDIYYSINDGADGYPYAVTTEAENVGSYGWTLPDISGEAFRLKVVARDRAHNSSDGKSAEFTISSVPTGETEPPTVSVLIKDVPLKSGDHIPGQPAIKVIASDNESITALGIKLYIDGSEVVPSSVLRSLAVSVEVEYQVPSSAPLAAGTHSIRAEATDGSGNTATREVTGLKVAAAQDSARLDYVVAQPTNISPARGQTSALAYVLNKDASVSIFFFTPGGQVAWTRKFAAGSMGGQAGYNTVVFNGISDISGAPLANGIYVYRIVAGGNVAGKGYMVIYD